MGAYYVRGFSTAVMMREDADLADGFALGVVKELKEHHTPAPTEAK